MSRINPTVILSLCFISLICVVSCSDSPTGPDSNVVTNPLPLAVGNRWDYTIDQAMSIDTDEDGVNDLSATSTGYQSVSINRTEAFSEGEAFGLEYNYILQYLTDPSLADTTVEVHYLLPLKDKILFKASETIQNNTGGYIPFGENNNKTNKLYTRISIKGNYVDVTFNELSRLLLNPLPTVTPEQELDAWLASDGLQNSDNTYYYDFDYIEVYNNLFKGFDWTSAEALGVGGVRISQEVTNILSELDGFEGPIAEVTLSNTFIDFYKSEQLVIRYYYKSDIGVIRAEIYAPLSGSVSFIRMAPTLKSLVNGILLKNLCAIVFSSH